MRIVSLLPSATEIAFALGLGDHVVAVSHECDYPPEARQRPAVTRSPLHDHRLPTAEIARRAQQQLAEAGTLYQLDLERLRALAPDLILTQELCAVCAASRAEVERAVRVLGTAPRVLSLEPNTLDDVLETIRVVGEATGQQARAEALVRELRARIERVRAATTDVPVRPRVVCLEWTDPPWVAGHWVPEMVTLAGGHDVLGVAGKPSVPIDPAAIPAAAPEVVVLMPCGFDLARTLAERDVVRRLPGWETLPAVQAGRVYAVDGSSYFNRPGPRLVDGLELLAHLLHPERVPPPPLVNAAAPLT
ncbi:MAG TPA: cobalamin-binding protein [Chloroflexota bacterium]|nr:cobalamin-binding protein [Chloroflexota bacterium]